jgi:hypothetical protein
VAGKVAVSYENCLTQRRQYRDETIETTWALLSDKRICAGEEPAGTTRVIYAQLEMAAFAPAMSEDAIPRTSAMTHSVGGAPMTEAERLREQAERCLRLARSTSDQVAADRLTALAAESG